MGFGVMRKLSLLLNYLEFSIIIYEIDCRYLWFVAFFAVSMMKIFTCGYVYVYIVLYMWRVRSYALCTSTLRSKVNAFLLRLADGEFSI